jgi:hypothetical protein
VVPKGLIRKGLPLLAAVALLTGPLVTSAQALPAAPSLAAQAGQAAQPAVNPDHIKVLTAALQNTHDNYASFANFTPGPQDIFDYNIGNLWLKGIDGSGTTVAVIEGEGGIFSEGAGFSAVFPRPSYQDRVARITGSKMRSVPDITMDAQSGTSESAPMVAGVLALATQLNHGQKVRAGAGRRDEGDWPGPFGPK